MTTRTHNGKFFIFDCNDRVVGNPNGYRTMRGATQQANSRKAQAFRDIWAAYDAQDPRERNYLVSNIKFVGV